MSSFLLLEESCWQLFIHLEDVQETEDDTKGFEFVSGFSQRAKRGDSGVEDVDFSDFKIGI